MMPTRTKTEMDPSMKIPTATKLMILKFLGSTSGYLPPNANRPKGLPAASNN